MKKLLKEVETCDGFAALLAEADINQYYWRKYNDS